MLPKKLKHDAIVEAICELRFDTAQPAELVVGRLLDKSPVPGDAVRLAVADIPAPVRQSIPDLQFHPWYEIRSPAGQLLRVGPNVLSYHRTPQYVGWDQFKTEISATVQHLFAFVDTPNIKRIGLRYVNAINQQHHYIDDVHDLTVRVSVADKPHNGPVVLHLLNQDGPLHLTAIRVASPIFAIGIPDGASAVVDVDVHTPDSVLLTEQDQIMNWIEQAHTFEKTAFFRLFPPAIIELMKEE